MFDFLAGALFGMGLMLLILGPPFKRLLNTHNDGRDDAPEG